MHRLLAENADYLGVGQFRGKLYDLGNYPGVIPSEHDSEVVYGEVYTLHKPEAMLCWLDEYEGCGGLSPLYRRELADMRFRANDLKVWIHIFNQAVNDYPFIHCGDYLTYLSQRS